MYLTERGLSFLWTHIASLNLKLCSYNFSNDIMYSYGPPDMTVQKQDGQLIHTYSSSVRIRGVSPKTYQRRWTIVRRGERESGISVLEARHDDIYIYMYICVCVCVCVCSDSSTENDFNVRLAKAWTAIDRWSIIWKSDSSNKIKRICGNSMNSASFHVAKWYDTQGSYTLVWQLI